MQQTLFGYCETTGGKARTRPISKRSPQIDEGEPLRTLFGLVETKAQARRRAKRIVQLLGAIEDAPDVMSSCENHIDILRYFIERSLQVELHPDDRDGLQRLLGDTEEVLTEADCEEMRSNPKIWRPYPVGWIGARAGEMYAAALHPKEIAYLREIQQSILDEVASIVAGVEDAQTELAALKAIGPLPEAIAQHYALTPEGNRRSDHVQKEEPGIRESEK
jgi:hypothetical protein